jgi:cobalt-zinc-cadmium resistance protein CzcA
LPEGLKIIPFYDRIELVTAAINTVRDALIEGIVLVTVVFFLFLGHVRSAIVVTVSSAGDAADDVPGNATRGACPPTS